MHWQEEKEDVEYEEFYCPIIILMTAPWQLNMRIALAYKNASTYQKHQLSKKHEGQ